MADQLKVIFHIFIFIWLCLHGKVLAKVYENWDSLFWAKTYAPPVAGITFLLPLD